MQTGVKSLLSNYIVEEAIAQRGLKVYGVIYDVACGKLTDLKLPMGPSGKIKPKKSDGVWDAPGPILKGNYATLVFGADGASMELR